MSNPSFDSMEAVRNRYREMIEIHGHALVAVFADEEQAINDPDFIPFVYSIGLTNNLLPELIMGARTLDINSMAGVVNDIAATILKNRSTIIKEEMSFTLTDGRKFNYRIVPVASAPATRDYLIQAEPVLRKPINAVSWVQISDSEGRWPGEESFEDVFQQINGLVVF